MSKNKQKFKKKKTTKTNKLLYNLVMDLNYFEIKINYVKGDGFLCMPYAVTDI